MRKENGTPPPPLQIQISLFNVTRYLEDSGIEVPFAFFAAFTIKKKPEGREYPCTKGYFENPCRMTLLHVLLYFGRRLVHASHISCFVAGGPEILKLRAGILSSE